VTIAQIKSAGAEHAVDFYRADDELVPRVAAYLKEALAADRVAVVIATEPHFVAMRQELAATGIDVQGAIDGARLIFLDANAAVDRLIVGGRIDREAFDREIGDTMRTACERGGEVRAYGEIVDLLWQAGNTPGAIELERLWNELIAELRFELLCAYHSEAAGAPEHRHALQEVCQLHTRREVSREFQPDDGAPRAARRFVQQALQACGHDGSVIDDARLLISELVTNAVVHTGSPFSVSIRSRSSKLRVSVNDRSGALPVTDGRSPHAPTGGRGLRIVGALADDWGVASTQAGKTVWAELSVV
jgi:anti-sigma regulatory factor (Ser/Thr protein kinase)